MKKQTIFLAILVLVAMIAAPALAKEKTDQEFVTKAAQGGMFEVAAGELVIERAAREEVKEFGRLMVSDHGEANAELRAIAETQGFDLPNEMGKEYEKNLEKLKNASDDEFDRKYIKMMVKDHEEDVKKFKKMEGKVENPELQAWVAKTLPVLENHLERAKTLKKAVKD